MKARGLGDRSMSASRTKAQIVALILVIVHCFMEHAVGRQRSQGLGDLL
jgi:hypothetical protein